MPFMTSSQETEWALFLQPRSPHRACQYDTELIAFNYKVKSQVNISKIHSLSYILAEVHLHMWDVVSTVITKLKLQSQII